MELGINQGLVKVTVFTRYIISSLFVTCSSEISMYPNVSSY